MEHPPKKRDWRISLGRNHYYVTKAEVDFYLAAVQQGVKFIQLPSGLVLAPNFLDIAPLAAIKAAESLDAGGWECSHGTIHERGASCYCAAPKQLAA
jgi:hypothetical protein